MAKSQAAMLKQTLRELSIKNFFKTKSIQSEKVSLYQVSLKDLQKDHPNRKNPETMPDACRRIFGFLMQFVD